MTYQFTEITLTILTAYSAPLIAIFVGALIGVLKEWF